VPPPAPKPAPTPKPAPKPAPVYSGQVAIKVFSGMISTGESGAMPINEKPKKWDIIERYIKGIDGVSQVSWNSMNGTIDVGYSGPYDQLEDIEKAAGRTGTKCALISPIVVKFRPYACNDDQSLIAALKGTAGTTEVIKDSGAFLIITQLESVDLESIRDAAKGAGAPGTINSHDYYELTFTAQNEADASRLERELLSTKYVLRVKIDTSSNELKVLVVRGRCSKSLVKKIAEKCGFLCKK
jgi:hypothetical protein